jgi:uncharacterized membrane-anchored protein YhcB (DUF1043 family)
VSVEIWILLLVAASAVAAALGYAFARRAAPSQAELESLTEELAQARGEAEAVQSSVNEHFEQSAVLFGKLAKDYREFLEHFSESAQELGLSEGRARELLEQGFQPLLTHEAVIDAGLAAAPPPSAADLEVTADEPATPDDQDWPGGPRAALEEDPLAPRADDARSDDREADEPRPPERVAEVVLEPEEDETSEAARRRSG